ncbi:MAG: ABC transporter permease [Candidatus Eisenbacteria bacterium]
MSLRVDPVRLAAMARKEAIQLSRDARSMILAFLLPVLLLILFGYAIQWEVESVPVAVLDQDRTARSRELVDLFRASRSFVLLGHLEDAAEIDPLLTSGRAALVLVIPPGFAADLETGRPAPVQAIVDGSDANTASIVLSYVQGITQSYGQRVRLAARVPGGAGGPTAGGAGGGAGGMPARAPQPGSGAVTAETRIWYNEELSSRNMIVPGLVAVIMMIIAAILTSLTIAREWERGTMEQLASTPVTRLEVIVGKLLPYLAIGMIDVAVCTILGVALFGVPFRGSPWLLAVLSFFFLAGALGLGIFISSVARTQLLATQMAMVATFMPAYLLSGFMFSIDVMPAPLRLVTLVVPARYFLVVTRGIFLKGVGVDVLFVPGLSMVAFMAAGLALAVRGFRKEL